MLHSPPIVAMDCVSPLPVSTEPTPLPALPPSTPPTAPLVEPTPLLLPIEAPPLPQMPSPAPLPQNHLSSDSADTEIVVAKVDQPANHYSYAPQSPASPLSSPPAVRKTTPRKIKADGVVFVVHDPEAFPNAREFGQRPPRATKRTREEEWEANRQNVLEDLVYKQHRKNPKPDRYGKVTFDKLPDWLNAVREVQDDGTPGVYLCRPSYEDFKNRFPEILKETNQIGTHLGAIKILIPNEWLHPTPNIYAPDSPTSSRPRSASPIHSHNLDCSPTLPKNRPKSEEPPPRKKQKTKKLADFNDGNTTDDGEPMIWSSTQSMPIHVHPDGPVTPIFKIHMTPKTERTRISRSKFNRHSLLTAKPQPNYKITEEQNILRGRTWTQIAQDNPGAGVEYSSDNDATPELRHYLRIKDPRLTELDGNVLDESSIKVAGIHTPYIYLGRPYTLFACHQEDYAAYSLNYHHAGAPKSWRVTSPLDYAQLESLAKRITSKVAVASTKQKSQQQRCAQFVRHNSLFFPKNALDVHHCRNLQMRQRQGELVVTWPGAYHEGWNEGDNINEAIGYGTKEWRDVWIGKGREVYRECFGRCDGRGRGEVALAPVKIAF